MISCGEASGDLYGAALVGALRTKDPEIDVFGFGGPRLAASGADLIGTYAGVTVTGLVEAASVLPRAWRMIRRLREAAAERMPDAFVAIDFPDFNLRLLPRIRQLDIPVVYYVSPQLWAWRPGRIEALRRNVDRMAVIFPFEQAIYEEAGVSVDFVGHPLVDLAEPPRPRQEWVPSVGLDPSRPIVALLPGSRPNEVRRILPAVAGAVPRIAGDVAGAQFLLARAHGLDDQLFAPLDPFRPSVPMAIVDGEADQVIAAADVVLTASGTATVQTALHGRPMVVVYELSAVTYAIARRLVRVPRYAMPNLVAGREIVPELIQRDLTPERVAAEVVSLLTDRTRADRMRADLADVRRALGGPGASARAADVVLAAARRRVGAR
jgi:lipid-A-disaccharide synthase